MSAATPDAPAPLPLPPFDPDACCPMCGHEEVAVRFCRADRPLQGDGGTPFDPPPYALGHRVWMRRACKRCEYRWAESPRAEPPPMFAPVSPLSVAYAEACARTDRERAAARRRAGARDASPYRD